MGDADVVNARLIMPVLDEQELKSDPLSPNEIEFLHLQRNSCAEVRAGWARSPGGRLATERRKQARG